MRVLVPLVASLVRMAAWLALALPASGQTLLDLSGNLGDSLGSCVEPAGDFDRDGAPDVLVGASQPYEDPARPTFTAGGVGILSGRDGRLLFRVTGDDYAARTGQATGRYFGVDAIVAGDLDHDGVGDVLVVHGNPKRWRRVVAFSGVSGAVLFEVADPNSRTDFGSTLLALGDVLDAAGNPTPDGTPDFAVGAPVNPISQGISTYPGLVHLYSGATPQAGPVITLAGVYPRIAFGQALALVGDLDGDGLPALAVGAPDGAYVEVFDGPRFASVLVLNSPFLASAGFGETLAHVGDVDGDGASELAIGVPAAAGGAGRVLVYSLALRGANELLRLRPPSDAPGQFFGTSLAGLPRDPLSGAGLLDLDHDGLPDPFLDWNHDGKADHLVGASGFSAPEGGGGGLYLVRGTNAVLQSASEVLHQGRAAQRGYSFLPGRRPRSGEIFASRLSLLGNAPGESQPRLAAATPNDEDADGHLAVLRLSFARFDDDTFSRANDVVGTKRELLLDFGPAYAGRIFYLLGSTAGAHPGLPFQGFTLPLNDDGPGGLLARTVSLQPGGTPLFFSRLTGVLDGDGRASIDVEVTAPTVGHPWFSVPRQDYVAVLSHPTRPGRLALVGAPTSLHIE